MKKNIAEYVCREYRPQRPHVVAFKLHGIICHAEFANDDEASKFADKLLKEENKLSKKSFKVFGKAPKNRQMAGIIGEYFNENTKKHGKTNKGKL